jgi:hypothetical protein
MAKPTTKIIHRAAKISGDGSVSALCFSKPHPIDLSMASWTQRDEAVTCPRCLFVMRDSRDRLNG